MNLSPYRNFDTRIEISIRRRGAWARLLRRVWVILTRLWIYGGLPLATRSKRQREYLRVQNNYILKYRNARLAREQEGRWDREDDR